MPALRSRTSAGIREASVRSSTNAIWSIHEHHGLAAVEDHAVLEMMTHGARQHAALDITALADEIFGRITVAETLDVLVDDRALIERAGDVMRGGADQFNAALMRLMIGSRALEARQK